MLGFVLSSSQFFTILNNLPLSHQAFLLILIFVLRKRMKLATELFRITNKAISSSPLLLVQPLWTFTILLFFWVLWVAVLLSLGTAGKGRGVGPITSNEERKPSPFWNGWLVFVKTKPLVELEKSNDNSDGAQGSVMMEVRKILFPLLYWL